MEFSVRYDFRGDSFSFMLFNVSSDMSQDLSAPET